MAIAENHQRFLQRIQLDLHGAGGFVLLMVGVGVAGGEKLRTGFRDSQVEHAAAQRELFGSQLPQLRFGAQAREAPYRPRPKRKRPDDFALAKRRGDEAR